MPEKEQELVYQDDLDTLAAQIANAYVSKTE